MTIKTRFVASALALTAVLGLTQAAGAAELGTTYDAIVEGAKQEDSLEVWVLIPSRPETHRAVIAAFTEKFGLDTQVNWVPASPVTALSRAVAEYQGGRVSVDVLEGSEEEVASAIKADIALKVDWSGIFAEHFPNIPTLEADMIDDFYGYALPYLDYPYGIGWNPNQIDESEVPSRFTDLADPKWKGKFGLNQINLVPIPNVAPFIGAEDSLDLAKRILENEPILIRGTPAIAQSIVTGAIPIGVTGYSAAETLIRNGEPIKFKLFEDFVPTAIQHLYVPKGSPSPNTAVLFAAWFSSEGYKIADEFEPSPQPVDPDSDLAKQTAEVIARGGTHAKMRGLKDLEVTAVVREGVSLLMSGQQ